MRIKLQTIRIFGLISVPSGERFSRFWVQCTTFSTEYLHYLLIFNGIWNIHASVKKQCTTPKNGKTVHRSARILSQKFKLVCDSLLVKVFLVDLSIKKTFFKLFILSAVYNLRLIMRWEVHLQTVLINASLAVIVLLLLVILNLHIHIQIIIIQIIHIQIISIHITLNHYSISNQHIQQKIKWHSFDQIQKFVRCLLVL